MTQAFPFALEGRNAIARSRAVQAAAVRDARTRPRKQPEPSKPLSAKRFPQGGRARRGGCARQAGWEARDGRSARRSESKSQVGIAAQLPCRDVGKQGVAPLHCQTSDRDKMPHPTVATGPTAQLSRPYARSRRRKCQFGPRGGAPQSKISSRCVQSGLLVQSARGYLDCRGPSNHVDSKPTNPSQRRSARYERPGRHAA